MKFSNKYKYIILLAFILLTACDNGEWWGDKKISRIESDHGLLIEMKYNDEGQLTEYRNSQTSQLDYNKGETVVAYDVKLTYTDSTVVIKGITPYFVETGDNPQYLYTETTYLLNQDGLAFAATTTCPQLQILPIVENKEAVLPQITTFEYQNNHLTSIYSKNETNGQQAEKYKFEWKENNLSYDDKISTPEDLSFLRYFTSYYGQMNKSGLMGALEDYIGVNEPAFYARILGRPSKNLIKQHVFLKNNAHIVRSYRYEYKKGEYVKKMYIDSSSDIRYLDSDIDPHASLREYTITYIK